MFGAGAVLYSLVTVYELGALRVIPMSLHLALDGIAGAVLAASPWLFGFSREVVWPHLLFGLFSVIASLITRTDPDVGVPRARALRGSGGRNGRGLTQS